MRVVISRRSQRSPILIPPICRPRTAVASRSISRNSPSNDRTPRLWLSARLADWVANRLRTLGDDGVVAATGRVGLVARRGRRRFTRHDAADPDVSRRSSHVGLAGSGSSEQKLGGAPDGPEREHVAGGGAPDPVRAGGAPGA